MKNQTKSLVKIASILSAALFTGMESGMAFDNSTGYADSGVSAAEASISTDSSSEAAAPPEEVKAETKTPEKVQNTIPLNNHFDTFEVEPPTGIDADVRYAGNVNDISFMSSTTDGLLPAQQKKIGKLFFDGWVTSSAYDHNEWPVTNGYDEDYEGRNSSVSPYQMNQTYVIMGREVEYGDHLSVGGRIDALYGTDYLLASSLGLESEKVTPFGGAAKDIYAADTHWNKNSRGGYPEYGIAVPQAYAEFYAPVWAGFTMQVGHFYSPMGYESVCSPNNFFHSLSYTKLYGQPQTMTGATGKLRVGNRLSLIGGAHQGWNVFDDNNNSWDVLGGFTIDGNPGDSFKFFVSSGDAVIDNLYSLTSREIATVDGRQTSYSLVLQKRLCEGITWVLEHDLGITKDAAYTVDPNFGIHRKDGSWYSVANYLYFTLAPTLDFGARTEWFCDHNHTRLLGGEPLSSQVQGAAYKWTGENIFDISLGFNWRPTQFITLRPEVRWDYSDIQLTDLDGNVLQKGIYNQFRDDNRLTFGGDLVVHF